MRQRILIDVVGRVLLAGCLFAGLSVMLWDGRQEDVSHPAPVPIAQMEIKHPLDAELLWCRHLGDEALRDKECLRAWSENRERFFKKDPREVSAREPAKAMSQSSTTQQR